MSLWDETALAAGADAAVTLPQAPVTARPERSAWSAVPRGIAGGAASLFAAGKEAGGGRSIRAEMQRPDVAESAPAKQGREERSARAAQGIDDARWSRDFERSMRPDPETASMAEQLLYGLGSIITEAVPGALVAGPWGAAATIGVAEGAKLTDDLQRQGVDTGTSRVAGAVGGVVMGAGAVIPMVGSTLAKTAALWAAGGPLSFMAQQQATRSILERADYELIAKQYDPLELTGLGMSIIPGAPFAAFRALQLAKAAKASKLAAKAAPEAGTVPPSPDQAPDGTWVDTQPAVRQAAPHELVDAAMVHNLTLQRDVNEASMRDITRANRDATEIARTIDDAAASTRGDAPALYASEAARLRAVEAATPDIALHNALMADMLDQRGKMLADPVPEVAAKPSGAAAEVVTERGNAVFAKAYGEDPALAALSESTNSNIRNILAGMLRAAPDVARVQDLIAAGARQPMDFAPDLVRAVRELGVMRERGQSVDQFIAQADMLDDGVSPTVNNLLVGLAENARAPKRVAEMIKRMVGAVDALGDPRQGSMLDDTTTQADVVADAVERLRTITDDQLTDTEPATIKPSTDPLMRSVADRVEAIEATAPEMRVTEDATVAEFMARIRREAAEGTDFELGALDADLLRIAADCALSMGAA